MQAGSRLADRYRLDERVGAGGMGEVWRATDEVLGRTVAVKVVLPTLLGEPGFVRRFLVEARAMASVRHPNVAAIHDYRSEVSGAFLVMEFVDGESLSHMLHRLGRLRPYDAMHLVAQAADALQAVHDKGIVHRDVKPGNLLIRSEGAVVLTDFGIARGWSDTALTTPGAILGTPSYLAPEQVLGQPATARSDVYALGLVAYECLSGRRPFEGDSPFAAALQRVREAPRTLGENLPRSVLAVVDGALATDPAHRWPTAADLAGAARQALTDLTPGARTTGPVVRPPTPSRRLMLAAGLAVLVAALGVGAWIWSDSGGTTVGGPAVSGTAVSGTATVGPSGSGPAGGGSGLAGFARCGDVYCPPSPMCWGGLTSVGGVAREPTPVDCSQPHYWETFVVAALPPAARTVRQDTLMDRPEIASLCSESVMAARSRDPTNTRGWIRDAWPVQIDAATWIVHCMANSGQGELAGTVFRSGRA